MRIYALVFGGLIVVAFLGFLALFLGEKAVLAVAAYQLRDDVAEFWSKSRGGSLNACMGEDEFSYGDLLGWQLRFVEDKSYVVEPVCSGGLGAPLGEPKTLFGGVRRLWGSGIFLAGMNSEESSGDAWVHLRLGESRVVVGLLDRQPAIDWEVENYDIGGVSPARGMCTNWGFSCCAEERQEGEGYQVWTMDCPERCFQQCKQLPVVTFFNTVPMLDPKTRTVVINEMPATVEFGFSVENDVGLSAVVIDFGDGTKSQPLGLQTPSLTHTYACERSQCVFTARLAAAEGQAVPLIESSLNAVTVIVSPL
jgi:hypothetical protein